MLKEFFREKFKNKAQRQQEENEKKRAMCASAIKAEVCPKCCVICAWNVK